jgi:hypothetical protein
MNKHKQATLKNFKSEIKAKPTTNVATPKRASPYH